MLTQKRDFRIDIACLRGSAVLLVLLNHFQIPGFQWGFIGVDVFFVISGYLISRILYKDYVLNRDNSDKKIGSISLPAFYLRRFRRLFPAAFVVILLTNLLSIVLFNEKSQQELKRDSGWAIFFFANVAFLRANADYFNLNSTPSLLQHYWSLSIEEQFYFIWPLFFIVAAYYQGLTYRKHKIKYNHRILLIITGVTVISYIFLQIRFTSHPLDAYFSIFTRAWELGIGGLFGVLAFQKQKVPKFSNFERIALLLFPLMISSVVLNETNWARWVLLPVFATGFFLYSGENNIATEKSRFKIILGISNLLAFLGKVSYSVYLVHWPIHIIALHYKFESSLINRIALVFLSIILGKILWKYVESKFMMNAHMKSSIYDVKIFEILRSKKYMLFPLIYFMILSLFVITYPKSTPKFFSNSELISAADQAILNKYADIESSLSSDSGGMSLGGSEIYTDNGTSIASESLYEDLLKKKLDEVTTAVGKNRLTDSEAQQFKSLSSDSSPFEKATCPNLDVATPANCDSGNRVTGAKKVALIGDSKMAHLAEPLISYFSKKNWHVVPWIMTGCNITFPVNTNLRTNCKARSDWVLKNVQNQNFDLIILAQYPGMQDITGQKKYFKELENSTQKLVVLMQSPTMPNPTNCIKNDLSYPVECSKIPQDFMGIWNSYTSSFSSSFSSQKTLIIEAYKWWCVDQVCPLSIDNTLATRDGSHLTFTYAKKLEPLIFSLMEKILAS